MSLKLFNDFVQSICRSDSIREESEQAGRSPTGSEVSGLQALKRLRAKRGLV